MDPSGCDFTNSCARQNGILKPGFEAMAQTIREKAKIRQNRDDDRPTEDDIARRDLGPRGKKGGPDTAKMTQDSELQTPSPIDPGHTV
jgi:hypothetical protein